MEGNKKDLNEFEREAKAFNSVNHVHADNLVFISHRLSREERQLRFRLELEKRKYQIGTIAFFGHGWSSGVQLGFNNKNEELMAEGIVQNCTMPVKILLYSCTTSDALASKDSEIIKNGFADQLRDALNAAGARGEIMGHDRAGHTARNPYAKRVCAMGNYFGQTDEDWEWYVKPGSELWHEWRQALKTDFRFTFPFCTNEQIAFYLGGPVDGPA